MKTIDLTDEDLDAIIPHLRDDVEYWGMQWNRGSDRMGEHGLTAEARRELFKARDRLARFEALRPDDAIVRVKKP